MEKKQRFAAERLTVVTEEKPTGGLNRPNIPDLCADGRSYIILL